MSSFLPPVVAELVAEVGKFTAEFGAAKAELTGFEAATTRLAAAGKVAMLGLGLAAAGAAVESVHLAADFDQAMELIHTQAGAAQSEVDGLKGAVLDLAPTVGIGPEKLAEGLYHIESTGFRGKQAMDILAASAKLAALGLADLDTVTFAMSGTMSVGMKDILNAADATNYLNTIVGMGDMKMDKLAAAIGTGVLPSFKSAGLGMMDFGAALATITDNSVGADEAATRLRMTVSMMAAPSMKAAGALSTIGISSTQLADDMRKPNGLLLAVDDLKAHLEASGKTATEQNAVISDAFGGGRTSSAILTLLEESDRLKSKYVQLGDAASRAKTADEAWQAQQQQFNQQLKELGAELQVIGVKVGQFLIPYIQQSASWLARHTEVVKIAAVVIGGVLVAAMTAFTASVVANTVAMLANPVTWIILGIVAAVALLAVGIYELVKHWSFVWGWIKRIAADVWGWLVIAWRATWSAIKDVGTWIMSEIINPIAGWFDTYLVKPIEVLLRYLGAVFKFWWAFFGVILGDFEAYWIKSWHNITDVTDWVWANILRPTFNAISDYGIQPTMAYLHQLHVAWDLIWHAIGITADWVWANMLRPTFNAVSDYGIHPIMEGIRALQSVWDVIWGGLGDTVTWIWSEILRPIFNAITDAIDTVKNGINDVLNAPSGGGAGLAHFLGFDEGGWVPGAPGAPMLAVVHGGEYVLSRDMISAAQGPSVSGMTPQPAMAAAAGARPVVVENRLYVDGRELHVALIPHAQQYKARNGTTGLS